MDSLRAGQTMLAPLLAVGLSMACVVVPPSPSPAHPSHSVRAYGSAHPARATHAGGAGLEAAGAAGGHGSAPAREPNVRETVVATALSMVGVPYRYGGSSPAGFDCSGLVVYSYARAGLERMPHSAAALLARARPIPEDRLVPGDLLFFSLSGKKSGHVAIYIGNRQFVHAPSSGKRVERNSLDHVYWREQPRRAGTLLP